MSAWDNREGEEDSGTPKHVPPRVLQFCFYFTYMEQMTTEYQFVFKGRQRERAVLRGGKYKMYKRKQCSWIVGLYVRWREIGLFNVNNWRGFFPLWLSRIWVIPKDVKVMMKHSFVRVLKKWHVQFDIKLRSSFETVLSRFVDAGCSAVIWVICSAWDMKFQGWRGKQNEFLHVNILLTC